MTDTELNSLRNKYNVSIQYDDYYHRYFIWLKDNFTLEGTKDHFFVMVSNDNSYNYLETCIINWFEEFYPNFIRTIKINSLHSDE